MTNRELRLADLKYKVRVNKNPNKPWKLNEEQIEYLTRLGYEVTPQLYNITTKMVSGNDRIIREVRSANKRGCKHLYKRLNRYEIEILDMYGIHYVPAKFTVRKVH